MKKAYSLILLALYLAGCTFVSAPPTPTQLPLPTETATIPPTSTFTPIPSPTPTLPAVLITSGDWTRPYAALTFDICQVPEYPAGFDAGIVNVLEQYKVPATFFLGGDWMRTHPDETKVLAANPIFELGNHSWSHPDFRALSDEEINQEIEMTQDMLFQLTGRRARLFRFPYGYSNDHDLQLISQHGLYSIQWDSVSGDPDPNFDAATILSEVKRTVKEGAIIIMHANGRGWHTAEALPGIIEYLQNRGYTPVTVSQLIGLEPIMSK